MSFTPTLSILAALKHRMEFLELEDGRRAFEVVAYYSAPDLIRALQELRIHKNRVCLIIPDSDEYENEVSGRVLFTRCFRRVLILLADRDFGRRQDAATGDGTNPGVILLDNLVISDLLGQTLGFDGVRVEPVFAQPVLITGKERDETTGREAWQIELMIEAGVTKT